MSADRAAATEPRSWAATLMQPFSVFLLIYFAYLSIVYSGYYQYAYVELMNLGSRIMGFRPSVTTLSLYLYGALSAVLGSVGGVILARRVSARDAEGPRPWLAWTAPLRDAARVVASWPVVRRVGLPYLLALAGWLTCFGMNVAQLAVGGVALTNIAARWTQSPILVWFALGQIFFVPALLVLARGRAGRLVAVALFAVSVVALGLLGARHMPAKLIIATFLAAVYVIRPKNLWRVAVVFLVLLVLALGVVGALSKSGIYGAAASAKLALGLSYSDSASTISNLDRIVAMTPSTGVYKGALLRDSILAAVPRALFRGVKPDYANYQLGRFLGGRKFFVIGDVRIDRSVSLAPTMLGAAYADFGVLGVAVQMILVGLLFGYLQLRARERRWLVPFLVTFGAYAIHGVNVALHNPHAIAATVAALGVMAVDVVAGHDLYARPVTTEE